MKERKIDKTLRLDSDFYLLGESQLHSAQIVEPVSYWDDLSQLTGVYFNKD